MINLTILILTGEKAKKKKVEKKEVTVRKPSTSSLSAAAALMGKQRLSSMFTSSVFKKNSGREDRVKGLSCDSIVDDVIAEFAPDEADRERRRRGHAVRNAPIFNDVKTENGLVSARKNLMGGLDSVNVDVESDFLLPSNEATDGGADDRSVNILKDAEEIRHEATPQGLLVVSKTNGVAEGITDDKDLNVIKMKEELVIKQEPRALNAKITEQKDPSLSATAGWKAVISAGNENTGAVVTAIDDKSDFELDSNGSLHFYMLDAHEEIYGANMGNLYMFGKVKLFDWNHAIPLSISFFLKLYSCWFLIMHLVVLCLAISSVPESPC